MKKNYKILGFTFLIEEQKIHNTLNELDFLSTPQSQEFNLDEDLLQFKLDNETTIDIGWYPSFDANGRFVVQRIKNSDWENPEKYIEVKWDKSLLLEALKSVMN
ncbi:MULTISPECIES: hypothetical protein [Tenebrionibacter/Tenebrionicola group]|jgi:hypothetical protein|uniref:Uncharacterized protein n=2 Tax=Tenebrionibacter/Tenebrionicola group TaxID=2969848 RepID=A0A8K0V0Q9_9ENTR|nr:MULTISPECIES: hypothetical protein [Tenebrionibacter/Tenebrionicola group]MBK4714727.1 hypothetical protein [Tenebrionibacter intestinalis]MBV5095199.1 hypothetical protein [Tenebrionicola larvae]